MIRLLRIARRAAGRARAAVRPAPPPPPPRAEAPWEVDLSGPEVARNPVPHWHRMREAGLVHFLPRHDGWIVLGYDVVRAAFAMPELLSNAPYRPIDAVLLGEDPPRQAAVRRIVSRHFTADKVGRLEAVAAATARDLLRPELDAMGGYGSPISRSVAAALIGFDAPAVDEILAASDSIVGEAALGALIATLDRLAPRAALYPAFLADGGGLIGPEEAASLIRLLWLAATTTTERVIGRAVLRLVEEPPLEARLRADRALAAPFLEEIMRLHPPEHVVPRLAAAPVEIAGTLIPAGAIVYLCVGAANRDPAQHEAPDELRLDRPGKRHFAFGSGIHHCVGAPLARRVAAQALGVLLDGSERLRPLRPLDGIGYFATMTALAPERVEIGL